MGFIAGETIESVRIDGFAECLLTDQRLIVELQAALLVPGKEAVNLLLAMHSPKQASASAGRCAWTTKTLAPPEPE
jgi:hypothetical protein